VNELPGEAGLIVLPPDEALRRARRLPSPDDLAIEGLTSHEWDALIDALTQR
jgi:hypothetical protein